MAMTKCPDCGKEISDKASACPHCGCPVTAEPSTGTIYFTWQGKRGDSLRKTTIMVDGSEIGVIKCGDNTKISVPFGTHKIDLYQGKHHLIGDSITIHPTSPDEVYTFKEKMGLSHAQLERVPEAAPNMKLSKNPLYIPRCPTCNSDQIKKLSITRKTLSFEMFGFASSSAGKSFECKNCGYKW